MNDVAVLASFGVGYVAIGLMVLAITAGMLKPQMKLVPVKVQSRRP